MGTMARRFKPQPRPRHVGTLVICAVLLAAAACGGRSDESSSASPQTRVLNWTEARGRPGQRLVVRVASVTVSREAWSVRASVTNDTATSLFIGRPHTDEPGTFGLLAAESTRHSGRLPTGLIATRYSPPLPGILAPGEAWSGTFSGPGAVPARRSLRIASGTFWAYGGVWLDGRRYRLFQVVTDHAFSLS
jgi:hypothetical protein